MAADLLVFGLGAAFAVVLQLFASQLTLAREKRKEAWVRRLNSYENFYRAMTHVIDLLIADLQIPDEQLWAALLDARKSAYDATSYDVAHGGRTTQMRELTLELLLLHQKQDCGRQRLFELRGKVTKVRDEFYAEEGIH